MTRLALVSALAMIVASGATAGNLADPVVEAAPVVAAPAPAATNWTGAYAGALAGWMTGETENLIVPAIAPFDGYRYGGFVGYNYQMDSGFVIGAEVAVSTGDMVFAAPPNLGATMIDLKARLGYAAGDALIYASGGYTYGTYSNGDAGNGWNLGAGVDFMVTDRVFIGAEYVYRDITDSVATPAVWNDRFGTIQARVGFKF